MNTTLAALAEGQDPSQNVKGIMFVLYMVVCGFFGLSFWARGRKLASSSYRTTGKYFFVLSAAFLVVAIFFFATS